MLKKILKVLAVVALIAVLSFAIIAIYSYSTIEIMRKGLDTITHRSYPDKYDLSENLKSPIMTVFRLDRLSGKVAVLLDCVCEGEKLSIFPVIKSSRNFVIYNDNCRVILSNPNVVVPYFLTRSVEYRDTEITLETAYVIFDVQSEQLDSLLEILNAKSDFYGNFDGGDLRFKSYFAKLEFTKDRSFFENLILRVYFILNESESLKLLNSIVDIWERYDAQEASMITWNLYSEYNKILFNFDTQK